MFLIPHKIFFKILMKIKYFLSVVKIDDHFGLKLCSSPEKCENSLIMHAMATILLSSLPLIIVKVHVKYLSQRVYGFQEKLNGQTDRDRQTYID